METSSGSGSGSGSGSDGRSIRHQYGMVEINSLTLYFMLFLILAGWVGLLFNHVLTVHLPEHWKSKKGSGDVYSNDNYVKKRFDKPFWSIACSIIIVFAIFFMVISSLVYVNQRQLYPRSSFGGSMGDMWGELLFSMTFVLSRLNIFFSEVFLMLVYIGFLWLNFKFYDELNQNIDVRSYNATMVVLLITTGLQILVFFYSYIIQRNTAGSSNEVLDKIPVLKNLLYPVRLLQLHTSPQNSGKVNDGMKYLNTLLIVISSSCLIFMYIILKFYRTDG